jgi:alpha-galactosidase
MTDDEYKAHFSMWAIIKSPLLMGNDLRKLSPKSLTILNNPAIIAISQDPLGRSAVRVRRDVDGVKKDKYGVGEIQVWSGDLWDHDQIVVFLNAGDEDREISSDLEEIFVADGPGGSAAQVHEAWDVYDLWADRMEDSVAEKILGAKMEEVMKISKELNWYNSTAVSYEKGLRDGDKRLMGTKVGSIMPEGAWTAMVPRHGVGVYRLRNANKSKWRKTSYKTEL